MKRQSRSFLTFGDPASIAIRDSITPESTPLERMHAAYGTAAGKQCGSCKYFKLESWLTVRCTIFQQVEDASGVWGTHWQACGKYRR